MYVLGIETSGWEGSVALLEDQRCVCEQRLNQSGRRHAQGLISEIRTLLQQAGLKPANVDLVAVSRGPGSFTGLRVGMMCAKTFAYATGCRFVAVDTFAAIVENLGPEQQTATVIEDAQRDDLFVGRYCHDETGHWRLQSPIRLMARTAFLQESAGDPLVLGPGLKKLTAAEIAPAWQNATDLGLPRASVIAELARRTIATATQEGSPTAADQDFWRAVPFYLRASAAEEKANSHSNSPT